MSFRDIQHDHPPYGCDPLSEGGVLLVRFVDTGVHLIVVAYLAFIRSGEALELRRGACAANAAFNNATMLDL